jgi:hypothetical protein
MQTEVNGFPEKGEVFGCGEFHDRPHKNCLFALSQDVLRPGATNETGL